MTETGSGVVYDGVPLDGLEVRVDPDGEIQLRGPMLLRAYRDGEDPKDADGWLATGDLGAVVGGLLEVHGRRGDLIITGGENVWPDAVEARLALHPAVSRRRPWPAGPTPSGASAWWPSSSPAGRPSHRGSRGCGPG